MRLFPCLWLRLAVSVFLVCGYVCHLVFAMLSTCLYIFTAMIINLCSSFLSIDPLHPSLFILDIVLFRGHYHFRFTISAKGRWTNGLSRGSLHCKARDADSVEIWKWIGSYNTLYMLLCNIKQSGHCREREKLEVWIFILIHSTYKCL